MAQYEVDAAVIPDQGRDVQCSNCGQTWFQAGKASAVLEQPQAATPAEFDDWDAPELPPELTPALPPEPKVEPQPAPKAAPKPRLPLPALSDDYDDEPQPAAPPAPRRALDTDLLAVLREEAEREVQARKTEGSLLESQPELALPQAPEPVEREASLKGYDDLPEPDLPAPARRDLLPDIEEINSTLRATSERISAEQAQEALPARKSGFGTGFASVLVAAGVALCLYLYAPLIAQKLPAAAPMLQSYRGQVDHGRLWLNGQMQRITQDLQAQNAQ